MTDDRLFHQVLEALRQSEARYRHLIEHATDIIYTHTLDGRIITVNKVVETVLGYSREELVGKSIFGLIVPEHRDLSRRMAEEKVQSPSVTSTTYTIEALHKNGDRVPLEVSTQVITDQGAPLAIQGVARDVTERQRAARKLQEREHFYRTITERSTDILVITDGDGTVRYLSPSFEAVLGYKGETLLGQQRFDLVHPDDVARLERMLQDLVANVTEFSTIEVRVRDSGGKYRHMDLRARNLLADPIINGIVIDCRDVTDRKLAEQALRRSEERFRKVIETSGEGIAIRDPAGYLTFANSRFAEMLGYPVGEMIGKHVREIVAPEFLTVLQQSFERRKRSGHAESIDLQFVRRDGGKVDAIIAASPMYDEHGNFIGSLGMITDITERKRLEAQLRQSQKMEAVGRLAGGVAHDFNNLLTAIRGHVDLLLQELEPGSALREDVQEIGKAAVRAASLTQQLLAFSRRQMLQPVVLHLDDVVRDIESLLRRLISEDIALDITLKAGSSRVRADRSQVEQVLMNLVVNARDAMPNGGRIRIVTSTIVVDEEFTRTNPGAMPGEYVKLCVEDTGVGMDPQTLSHVFEPFFTTKDVGKGTGLGLATVYGIVKQSGGYIRVTSEIGRGSTFEIYLPEVQDPVLPGREAERALPVDEREGGTILVAEDEDAVRALTVRILRKRGYQVLEARDGRNALDIAREYDGDISLLVTDVIMPHMGGRELSERLAEIRPDIKILFMSGYTDDQLLQRGVLQSGSGNFLEKPFTPDALASKVREVLETV
jgi:two-component system, cell cycle sensor histidine kinase and response regulator CckA